MKQYYVRKADTTRLLLALGATLRHDEPARPWQSSAMAQWYSPSYQEYTTAMGMLKMARYDVVTPMPIAQGSVPVNANVIIACTAALEAKIATIPYLWTDDAPPRQERTVSDVVQATLFDTL